MSKRFDLRTVDPGIRGTVKLLRQCGFCTTDSGDGKTKLLVPEDQRDMSAMSIPNVAMVVKDVRRLADEADRLFGLLRLAGLDPAESVVDEQSGQEMPAWQVEATYWPATKTAVLLMTGVDDARLGRFASDQIWLMASGKTVPVGLMTEQHARNSMRFLQVKQKIPGEAGDPATMPIEQVREQLRWWLLNRNRKTIKKETT